MMRLDKIYSAAIALALLCGGTAMADAIPYPRVGTQNPVVYTFEAQHTGDVTAYFMGSTAAFDEDLGMLVDGKDSGVMGLENHSTANGASLDFGKVAAGSVLTFYINVDDFFVDDTPTYYSDPTRNPGGINQVYSTNFSGGGGVPAGTFVAFEDLSPANRGETSDFNYNDETFVFTNVGTVSAAPEPAAWMLIIGGVGMIGLSLRHAARGGWRNARCAAV